METGSLKNNERALTRAYFAVGARCVFASNFDSTHVVRMGVFTNDELPEAQSFFAVEYKDRDGRRATYLYVAPSENDNFTYYSFIFSGIKGHPTPSKAVRETLKGLSYCQVNLPLRWPEENGK